MLPSVYLDFETQSTEDLIAVGTKNYAWAKHTRMVCLSYAVEINGILSPIKTYEPTRLEKAAGKYQLPEAIRFALQNKNFVFLAHNVSFDAEVFHRFYGIKIEAQNQYCSMSLSRFHGLPGNLQGALKAAGTELQKDMAGSNAMEILMKPKGFSASGEPVFHEREDGPAARDLYDRTVKYCEIDVGGMISLFKILPPMDQAEREIFELHVRSNELGVYVDVEAAKRVNALGEQYKEIGMKQLTVLTEGVIEKPTQVVALAKWVKERIPYEISGLDKHQIDFILEHEKTPETVKKVVLLRQLHSQAASGKLKTLVDRAYRQRLYDSLNYCGAITHRWSSYGVQIQNLAKPDFGQKLEHAIAFIEDVLAGKSLQELEAKHGDFNYVVSHFIRAFFVPAPGMEFITADLSAIEARGIAYLALEESIMNVYRQGGDTYIETFAAIAGIPPSQVTKDQRQVGKVFQLSMGYGGGVDAVLNMAKTYGVDMRKFALDRFIETNEKVVREMLRLNSTDPLKLYEVLVGAPRYFKDKELSESTNKTRIEILRLFLNAKKSNQKVQSSTFSEEQYNVFTGDLINNMVYAWRNRYTNIKGFWKDLETAAVRCISTKNPVVVNSKVKFEMIGQFLSMRLPSGNYIRYLKPSLSDNKTVSFVSMKNKDSLIIRDKMQHGGKWAENATQSFSRDVFGFGMVLGFKRYNLIPNFHVHDEVIYSVPKGKGELALSKIEDFLSVSPPWASDIPLKAEAKVLQRYWKG